MLFSGSEEAGHLRRVGVSGEGGVGLRKVRGWQKHSGKWERSSSQGLEGSRKSSAELGGYKMLAALACITG